MFRNIENFKFNKKKVVNFLFKIRHLIFINNIFINFN